MRILRRLASLVVLFLLAAPASARAIATTKTIDVFGDSISSLCGASPTGGWCAPLQQMLAQAGIEATFVNHALSGADCGYSASNAATWLAADHPDLVVLACGTNQDTTTATAIATAGAQWRTIVEADHAAGALTLPSFIQYSDLAIQQAAGRPDKVASEERFNDFVVFGNLHYYQGVAGWLANDNPVDFQQVPSSSDYTLRTGTGGVWDGIHPTALGYEVYAALIDRQLAAAWNLSYVAPQPCGMTGLEARGPTYEQYINPIQCTGTTP